MILMNLNYCYLEKKHLGDVRLAMWNKSLPLLFFPEAKLQTPVKKLNTGSDLPDHMEAQCKEEQDHIPIIKINSVCSIASPNTPHVRQVITDDIIQSIMQPW